MKHDLRRIIRYAVCTVAFLVLTVGGWRYLSNRMELKGSNVKYDGFFETADSVDVLFFGSSHMINAVFPDQLWENYGITSYNMANHGEQLPTSYEVFRNALNYSSPQAVVVDLFTVSQMGTYYNKSFSHISLDAFPLTWTKFQSVNALFEDTDIRCEFLSNFCLYHSRWDEYLNISPDYTPSVLKGAEMRVNVETSVGGIMESDNIDETMTDGIVALLKFKKLCDERGIKLLCINIPYSGFEERDAATNYAANVMRSSGITYLDFRGSESDLTLNPRTDFYDTQHLNPLGGRKVTEYLGKYLTSNFGVQDRRDSNCANKWNDDVALCTAERENQLKKQAEDGKLLNTLMMMNANVTKGIVVITPYAFFRNQGVIADLLQQMGFDISEISSMGMDCAWVGVYDNKNKTSWCGLVNSEISMDLSDVTKSGDTFHLKYEGNNAFKCSYNDEDEVGLHNQMMMVYMFDGAGNPIIEKGFGTS